MYIKWIEIKQLLILLAFIITQHVIVCREEKRIANIGEDKTFSCRYNTDLTIDRISWFLGSEKDPIISYNKKTGTSAIDSRLRGRGDINPTTGDLTIKSLKIQDEGQYQCFLLISGASQETNVIYTLQVYAPPEEIAAKCSTGKGDGAQFMSCDEVPSKDITAVSFTVVSKPSSDIKVHEKPEDCKTENIKQKSCRVPDPNDQLSECTVVVSGVCDGTYQALVVYQPNLEVDIKSGKITVGEITSAEASQTPVVTISVILVICVILIVVVGLILLYRCVYIPRRNNRREPAPNDPEKQQLKSVPADVQKEAEPDRPGYEGDLPVLGSNMSTNEKRDGDDSPPLARQDSVTGRKEDDPFLPDGEGTLDLREDDSPPHLPPDAGNKRRVQVYSMNPNKMSVNTRGFIGAQHMMAPNTKMKYTKEEPDGTKRTFEIEKTDADSEPVVRMMKPEISQQPTITEVESENEESMIRQDSLSSLPKKA